MGMELKAYCQKYPCCSLVQVPTRKRSMDNSVLNSHIRQIRNIQIIRKDLEPLLPGVKIKFPSTTINTYGAFTQQVEQNLADSTGDFTIFSSWLGPLATGKIKDGRVEGSFIEHVIAAIRQPSNAP